jgi:hypothetical protein
MGDVRGRLRSQGEGSPPLNPQDSVIRDSPARLLRPPSRPAGIVVHGWATIIGRDDEGVEEIEPVWRDIYDSRPFEWGEEARR